MLPSCHNIYWLLSILLVFFGGLSAVMSLCTCCELLFPPYLCWYLLVSWQFNTLSPTWIHMSTVKCVIAVHIGLGTWLKSILPEFLSHLANCEFLVVSLIKSSRSLLIKGLPTTVKDYPTHNSKKLSKQVDVFQKKFAGCIYMNYVLQWFLCNELFWSWQWRWFMSVLGPPTNLAQSCLTFGAFAFVAEHLNKKQSALAHSYNSRESQSHPTLIPSLAIPLSDELKGSFLSFCQLLRKSRKRNHPAAA